MWIFVWCITILVIRIVQNLFVIVTTILQFTAMSDSLIEPHLHECVFPFLVSIRLHFFLFLFFFSFAFSISSSIYFYFKYILKQLLRQFLRFLPYTYLRIPRYKIRHQCKYHKAIHTRIQLCDCNIIISNVSSTNILLQMNNEYIERMKQGVNWK